MCCGAVCERFGLTFEFCFHRRFERIVDQLFGVGQRNGGSASQSFGKCGDLELTYYSPTS